MIEQAVAFILDHSEFILVGHVSADGDTLGCCLALNEALLSMNKRSRIVFEEEVPFRYAFLPCSDRIEKPGDNDLCEACICLDCADLNRAGTAVGIFHKAKHTLCIDHHRSNKGFADVNVILDRASCGEILVEILQEMNVRLTENMGICLYTAISSDTGNFSYSGVTSETFLKMAEVMKSGFDLPDVNRKIFRSEPMRKVRLRSYILKKMRSLSDGRVTLCGVSRKEYTSFGGNAEDLEGIVDSLRDIENVCLSALVHEAVDGSMRVSFRSVGLLDVGKIAVSFDGGGHRNASGCTLHTTLEEAMKIVEDSLTQLIMESES